MQENMERLSELANPFGSHPSRRARLPSPPLLRKRFDSTPKHRKRYRVAPQHRDPLATQPAP